MQRSKAGERGLPSPTASPGIPSSQRVVYFHRTPPNTYPPNVVYTTKYTRWNFLFRFLGHEFSKSANIFFGCMGLLQQIPNMAPTNRYATVVPLTFVISVSAVRELYEDWKRLKADHEMNNKLVEILEEDGAKRSVRWADIQCGQILRIVNGESVPADMIILATSLADNMCYVETSSIDGETNLKIRQARQETADYASMSDAVVKCELPNCHIYTFEGVITHGDRVIPLGPDQFLHRGCVLRNTEWLVGVVIYAGHDTKLMRNMRDTPMKSTRLEASVNRQIVFMFGLLLAMATVTSACFLIGQLYLFQTHSYLFPGQLSLNPLDWIMKFCTFILLYHNLIPISLYITLELVRVRIAEMINSDVQMYHEATDTPAVARTSSLVEELGQVEYILSDKTGTLTCNQMTLKHLVVEGQLYQDVTTFFPQGLLTNRFITGMAVCHTAITETVDGTLEYQGSSPDEIALVKGLAQMGCVFTGRKPRMIYTLIGGEEVVYELLALIEFNSTRKRMSVLVRHQGETRLIVKGADTVIVDRLKNRSNAEQTLHHLEKFAGVGLRTLCYAQRTLDDKVADEWTEKWNKAQATVNNRQSALDDCAAEIEVDLELVGATAVEDLLQDGVPETIRSLRAAGIKFWVLTGDRTETAINIGYSAGLLDEDSELLLCGQASSAIMNSLCERALLNQRCSLIIDGRTLEEVLRSDALTDGFLRISGRSATLICCRVSPLQKAQITTLVKERLHGICLAIGDGANDVSMIQSAHVGIGISGNEGLQAARAADFSIAQFRFLARLLLVHGSWSYHRISKVALYSTYKNITLVMNNFWFAWLTQWSGQTLFESWMIAFYNVAFTALPPLVLGVTDKYVDAKHLLKNPQLYKFGPRKKFFNSRTFWQSSVNGIFHSLMIFSLVVLLFWRDPARPDGTATGHWWIGCLTYLCVLLTVTFKLVLLANFWTALLAIVVFLGILFWFLYFIGYTFLAYTVFPSVNMELKDMLMQLVSSPVFWLVAVLLPTLCLSRDLLWKFWKRQFKPREYHIMQEIELEERRKGKSISLQPKVTAPKEQQGKRRVRGFSFSQTDSGQSQVLRTAVSFDRSTL